jgi:hypothetical protein
MAIAVHVPDHCRELFPQVVRVMREMAAYLNAQPQVRSTEAEWQHAAPLLLVDMYHV